MRDRTPRIDSVATLAKRTLIAMTAALMMAGGTMAEGKRTQSAATLSNPPVLLPVAADPTVAIKIQFAVGAQNDPAGKEGLAFLTATVMAEGATASHSYPEILKLLYPMATSYSVRVDKERITFSGRVHKDNLAAYTPLLLDAVRQPAFAESDFQRLKQRTIDGIEMNLRYSSDEELGKAVFYDAAFAGTPYGHLTSGTVAGLKAITRDDIKAFYVKAFTRDTAILALGGGFDGALVVRIQGELAKLPAGGALAAPPIKLQPVTGRHVTIVAKSAQATAISFGFPLKGHRGEREFYALALANSWFGEHRNSSSHLYQVIREARGMNYGDYSYIEIFPEGGFRTMPPTGAPRRQQLFEVWIRPVPGTQAHFALRAAVRELESLAKSGLTKEQFELTRSFLSKYCLHFAETTEARLGYALDDRFYGIPAPGHLANLRRIIPTLTLKEVNAAIRANLKPENLVIAMVGDKAEELATALAAGTPSPITYTTPKPDAVLAEDKLIATWPLSISREAVTIVPVDQVFAK